MVEIAYKQIIKRVGLGIFSFMLVVGVVGGLSSCATDTASPTGESEQQESSQNASDEESIGTVTLRINTEAIDGGELIEKSVKVYKGDTALSLLTRAKIDYTSEDSEYGTYVTSINGLAQGDQGGMSGWLYYVNGGFAEEAADKYEVVDTDVIEWQFSTGEEFE